MRSVATAQADVCRLSKRVWYWQDEDAVEQEIDDEPHVQGQRPVHAELLDILEEQLDFSEVAENLALAEAYDGERRDERRY